MKTRPKLHKRVLIINGHPGKQSLVKSLAESYADGARSAQHDVKILHLNDIQFDADHGLGGYQHMKPLEQPLQRVLQALEWANHVVLATPMWWGGLPAKLKGLFDRVLIPGRAFNPRIVRFGAPQPMLGGKTARLIVTSDTPGWFMQLAYRNALFHQVRGQIFGFVGIKPTRITHFNRASHPDADQVRRWQKTVRSLGETAC